ncbi:MAG: ribonuclease Z [Candidatus Omnitrophota bacterium]
MIELCVVGSGTGIPSPRRASPAFLLSWPQKTLLIDAGPGTVRRLAELGVTLHEIDGLFFTHLHPDHVADLIHFFFASRDPFDPRKKGLVLFGARRLRAFYEKQLEIYEGAFEPPFPVSFVELQETQRDEAHFRLFTLPLSHTPHSLGFRFEIQGKVVVFSGDTDVCENLVALAHGADLLVLECSFPNALKVPGHLIPRECGQIATRSSVKKLLLTHCYPPCDQADVLGECRAHFSGEILLATDSLRVRV